MKQQQKILVLLVILFIIPTIKNNPTKPEPPCAVKPQWDCSQIKTINQQAHEDGSDNSKCQYQHYLLQYFKEGYKIPPYPQCYAQMNTQCTTLVNGFEEKKNIRIFTATLQALCDRNEQVDWEDFLNVLQKLRDRYQGAYYTQYWQCVRDKATEWAEQERVLFPSWPAPYLDVLDYVCQSIVGELRNTERKEYIAYFESEQNFKKLPSVGTKLWAYISESMSNYAGNLNTELKQCYLEEFGYFQQSVFPEVEGTYHVQAQEGKEFEQAYVYIEQNEELDGGAPYNEDEEGYECWNYYMPTKHYHEKKSDVSEAISDGDRGHPLCGENSIYQPITMYGPLCCPIHPINKRPYTYDCCQNSWNLSQMRGRKRMRKQAACYGCYCLDGYELDLRGDYWGEGLNYGSCIPVTDGEINP